MRFSETPLPGVVLVELEPISDERGYFARMFCARELDAEGLVSRFVQTNTGFNERAGTLRGMHLQSAPHAEVKLVRCTRGVAFDVAVDLRPDSPTYRSWVGFQLTEDNGRQLYIPEGCAHGYLTLEPRTEVVYQTSAFYARDHATGVHHADPAFGIEWPADVEVLSERDRTWPLLEAA
jgi:dTDP-4-dehydrorhamnose 3,5-epimerase